MTSDDFNFCDCGGCPDCWPYGYYALVDLLFLKAMRKMYDDLKRIAPDHVAPYWDRDIDDKMAEAVRYKPT